MTKALLPPSRVLLFLGVFVSLVFFLPAKFLGRFGLSGMIRANRFAWFTRSSIGWFARIGNSSASGESAWRARKIGVSVANDSRESIRANRPCQGFGCFLLIFQGFSGFVRWEKCLVFLRFSLVFSKRPRKEGQGIVGENSCHFGASYQSEH